MSDQIGKVVFMAEVNANMQAYKENLVRELEHNGCLVIQGEGNTLDLPSNFETIQQCNLAIHILSNRDQNAEKFDKGMEELQIQTSVQHYLSQKLVATDSNNEFKIYAWHPKSNTENIYQEVKVPPHLKKIQQLEEVELLRTNFEEFKYYLLKKIEYTGEEIIDEFYIKGNDNRCIYFIYDLIDKTNARPYIEYLKNRGYTVTTPEFEGDLAMIRQTHYNSLKKFDAVIIFAYEAGINWVNMKIMDILKSPGLGREKPILGKTILTTQPLVKGLQSRGQGFEILGISGDFNKEQLEKNLNRFEI